MQRKLTWYEFFAGGGMARLGLGKFWDCIFANEWCPKKTSAYRARFGECKELKESDVAKLKTQDLPAMADLVWASFPCQDLSLAGYGAGLMGKSSGSFKPFWALIKKLIQEGRPPQIIVLENVVGALTSHNGQDFETLIGSLTDAGYHAGAMVIDAIQFVPQSRPRLFFVAVRQGAILPATLYKQYPNAAWHPPYLRRAYSSLPKRIQDYWMWWNIPEATEPISKISELIEPEPQGVRWHTKEQTGDLIGMMSEVNKAKLREVQASGKRTIGTIYRRTRPGKDGQKHQRAEVRFDEIAGCLRTPGGGSSRQTVLIVEGKNVSSRLLSPREAARLMGVPDNYPIPPNYNEAYHLFGDGLVVPAVAWLEKHLLRPLALINRVEESAENVA